MSKTKFKNGCTRYAGIRVIELSETLGIASNDLGTFDFKRKERKVYPLDKDAVYPEKAAR